MSKKSDKLLVSFFLFFLGGMLLANLLTPHRVYSLRENRYLAAPPELGIDAIFSGRFSRQFEDFITDGFALRDHWVLLKSDLERLMLRRENNGVFFGGDGYLLEDFSPGSALERNTNQVNRFAQSFPHLPVYLLLAPGSVAIYPEKLPPFANVYDQRLVLDQVEGQLEDSIDFVQVYDILARHKDQSIYFRTDHHWTMRGAYLAYTELAARLDLPVLAPEHLISEVVTEDFWGTYYSKANNRWLKSDEIEVLRPEKPVKAEIRFNDREGVHQLYFPEHLETRDKYAYFLDGNHPLAVITTDVENDGRLAVFKDSYAHALLPFLAQHYGEIHVIDLRFFTDNLGTYLEENQIDAALFLYSISGFSRDNSLINFK